MKSTTLGKLLITIGIGLLLNNSLYAHDDHREDTKSKDKGSMVIANRASSSLSIIDVKSNIVSKTIDLPAATNPAQPMYVVHSPKADRVFVGDRGNNRVLVLNDEDFTIETSVPTGNGVFHMWADPGDTQL